jgi:SlyX protein
VSQDTRVELIEIKVAHLERALQELSDVLFRQQQQIDAQNARHLRLLERLESADANASPESQFEVPPHY